MALDPSLITETLSRWQAPAPVQIASPIQQYATLQALRQGITQQQIQSLQLKQAQDADAQRQRDLNDDQILQAAAQDPDTMKAVTSWDGVSPFPLAGRGLQFKTLQAAQAKVLADQKAQLDWTEAKKKAHAADLAEVGKVLPGMMYDANGQP